MKKSTFNRNEFYELIWSQPMTSIAKTYNISSIYLKKLCVQMNIPIPKSGHWMKIKFGKKILIEPLSSDYNGEDIISLIQTLEGQRIVSSLSPLTVKQKEIENMHKASIETSGRLSSPDKLITDRLEAIKNWEIVRKSKNGLYASYPRGILDIDVSNENYRRALRFMDAFIKLAKVRGHEVICDDGTYIIVKGLKMRISLVERMKREMVLNENTNWKSAKYSSSGVLVLRFRERAYRTTDWAEGKQPIEKLLSKIMASVELKAKELIEYQIRLEKSWEEQRIKREIIASHERLVKKELEDFKQLIVDANRWHQIKMIRSYIDDIEAKSNESSILSEEIINWIKWARNKADWFEPKSQVDDELLRDIDKNTFEL